jgi:hypothetical protein
VNARGLLLALGQRPLHVRLTILLASCRSGSYNSHSTGAGNTRSHEGIIGLLLARRMRKSSLSRWASVFCCLCWNLDLEAAVPLS